MKRTNIVLDEDLVRRERQKRIRGLRGKIRWEGDLGAMRRGRTRG